MAAQDSPKGYDVYFEDFHGDTIPDELASSSDTGTVSVGTPTDASCLRLNNSNAGNNDMAEADLGATYFRAQDGHMWMETRVRISSTTSAVNVGFNDETLEGADTLPVELAVVTFTANAGTWIGLVYDSGATNDNWHAFWVDDSGATTTAIATLNSGIALVANKWYTIRIDVYDNGASNQARAEISITDGANSKQWIFESCIDRDAALVPHFAVENRTTAAVYMDVDYLEAGKSRVVNS